MLEPAPGPGGGVIPPHHGEGNLHLCFAIPFGELSAWEAHLRDQGIEVESRLRWARGGTSLYFRDPEGNSLEVATRAAAERVSGIGSDAGSGPDMTSLAFARSIHRCGGWCNFPAGSHSISRSP